MSVGALVAKRAGDAIGRIMMEADELLLRLMLLGWLNLGSRSKLRRSPTTRCFPATLRLPRRGDDLASSEVKIHVDGNLFLKGSQEGCNGVVT